VRGWNFILKGERRKEEEQCYMGKMSQEKKQGKRTGIGIMLAGAGVLLAALVLSSLWFLKTSQETTEKSVYDVSELYLKELAEQKVKQIQTNLDGQIRQMEVTINALKEQDEQSREALQDYIRRMQRDSELDYFALIDEEGTVYLGNSALSVAEEMDALGNDFNKPIYSYKENLGNKDLIMAVLPVKGHHVEGRKIVACVGGIDVKIFSKKLTLQNDAEEIFCELLRSNGNYVIRTNHTHISKDKNLFTALEKSADFKEETSLETMQEDMRNGEAGLAVYHLQDVLHYTYYAPVGGTDWYVKTTIHYDFVSEKVDVIRTTLTKNSLIQLVLILMVLFLAFNIYLSIRRRNESLQLEKIHAEESSRAKSAFLSNMSHDIRTPMNAIIGFTTLAIKCDDNMEKVQAYLSKILASSNHLLTLINDVLEMSRIESGKIYLDETECNLSEILHDLNTIIIGQIEGKQQELVMNALNVENEDVYCDKLRLNQVLLNLLSNAIKFTPSGGKIFVIIEQKKEAPEGYGSYVIRVKDTGIGMTPEFAEKVFKPFERERTSTVSGIQGTGLGMAITKNIIDMMKGTIEVKTAPGKGTEYIIQINLRLQEKESEARSIEELKGVHVLVVDDDFDACDATTRMLVKLGMHAEWTMSGKEAILRAKQSLSLDDEFGIYIIDWRLPDIGGTEVARQIRAIVGDDAPIIIMTAYDWADIKDTEVSGVNAFCNKPVFMSDLQAALLRVVGRHNPVQEKSEEEGEKIDFQGKRVLLVEDNSLNREIASEILTDAGIEIEEAENGAIAVEMVQKAEPGYYDLILMDVQMPVMDGHEATRKIRSLDDKERASVVIVAMTANAFEEDKLAAAEAGMNGHIAKPLDVDVLFETLGEILNK